MIELHKYDMVYYARIIPKTGVYEVCELIIRTIADTYFVDTDKRDKRAYLLSYKNLNKTVFKERNNALKIVKNAEKNRDRSQILSEKNYEEY